MLPTIFGSVTSLEILIVPLISWTMYMPNSSNSVLEGCLLYLFVPPWLPFSSPRDYTSLSSSIASIIYYIFHHPFTLSSSALSYSLEAAPTHSTCYCPFWNPYFLHSQTLTGTRPVSPNSSQPLSVQSLVFLLLICCKPLHPVEGHNSEIPAKVHLVSHSDHAIGILQATIKQCMPSPPCSKSGSNKTWANRSSSQ